MPRHLTLCFMTLAAPAAFALPVTVDPGGTLTSSWAVEWETAGNAEGWSGSGANVTVSDGILSGMATSADSRVQLANFAAGPSLDLGYTDFLELRVQVPAAYTGPIQIHYGTTSYTIATATGGSATAATTGFAAARLITIAPELIPKDGAFHTYRIDLGLEPSWRATLRDLRVDAVDGSDSSGMEFALDYVRIGDEPAAKIYQPRFTTECPAAGGTFTLPGGVTTHTVKSMESKHFRFLWSSTVETNPAWTTNMAQGTLRNLEECWQVFVKKLGYREPSRSIGTTAGTEYKLNVTSWHSGYWAGPDDFGGTSFARLNITPDGLRVDAPTWVIPHELMHCFQFHNTTGNVPGEWFEFHANYGRERWLQHYQAFYPNTSGIDPTHLRSAHLNIGAGREYYLCWPFFQYLDENPDGLADIGEGTTVKLWQQTTAGEYPFMALERLTPTSTLKDIVGNFGRRGATHNYSSKTAVNASLALFGRPLDYAATARWQFTDLVQRVDDPAWWRVPYEMAPMQGGYTIHELIPTGSGAGRVVEANLRGLADSTRGADWRASFIVIADDGSERYSPLWGSGTHSVTLAANENKVYLSVTGTPDIFYYGGADEIGYPYRSHPSKTRFPYELQVTGATPRQRDNGAPSGLIQHANGGGYKASTATVAATAYIGPNARVLNTARVQGNARVEDFAVVSLTAQVSGDAVISGHALVRGGTVGGGAKVRDWALVEGGALSGNARVLEHGNFKGGTATDTVTIKGNAASLLGNLTGNTIIDGDYGDFFSGRDIANSIVFGHLPYAGAPDSYLKTLPTGLYASYDFPSAHDSRIRDQYGVTDGFMVGSPAWIAGDAKRKGFLSFNGSTQSVVLDRSIADMRSFTFAAWVKPQGGMPNQAVLWLGATAAKRLSFTPDDGAGHAKFSIVNGGAGQSLSSSAPLPPGVWTHVAVTLDSASGNGVLYLNGTAATTGQITIRPDQLLAANTAEGLQHNYLARAQGAEMPMFAGALDNVQFHSSALQAEDILAMQPPTERVSAGTLYVDLRASDASAGATTWINNGTLGNFARNNSPAKVTNVAGTGVPGVQFSSGSQYYTGPTTPTDLDGSSDRSIEVWAFNPSATDEESMVSWGYRGTVRRSMSFNYGSTSAFNAVTHWGEDMTWGTPPAIGTWHHLVYTYDGNLSPKIYVDGVQTGAGSISGALLTFAGETINIACQRNTSGGARSKFYIGYLNSVRVHGGELTATQITGNHQMGPFGAPGNAAPTAVPQSLNMNENATVPVMLSGADSNGDSLSFIVNTPPSHGSLSGIAPDLTYTPAPGYSGADSFTFLASDGVATAEATVSITVAAVNITPVLGVIADQVADHATAVVIPLEASDAESPVQDLAFSGEASNGSLLPPASIVFTGTTLTLTPAPGQSGTTEVTVTVSDGTASASRSFSVRFRTSLETWRKQHLGTDIATGDAADSSDPDGDGQSNLEEYIAGTLPTSGIDCFRLIAEPPSPSCFSTSGKPGRVYIFQRNATLSDGQWQDIDTRGPLAGPQQLLFQDPEPPSGASFYRLTVQWPGMGGTL